MTSKPISRSRIFGRRPVGTDFQDQKAFDVLRAYFHIEAQSFLANFPRYKVGAHQHTYSFGINPERGGFLIDFGLDVLNDLLRQRKVVFGSRNQDHIAPGLAAFRRFVAKRIIGHGQPFRKSLVTGISEINRFGLTTLMHRHHTGIAQAPKSIERQSRMNALNVLIARIVERAVRQVGCFVAQCHVYIDLFVHGRIVRRLRVACHSYFSVVVFVHSCNVNAAAQQRNAEINRSSAA